MAWNAAAGLSQDYSSIRFMFSNEQHVWKPSIYVENSVEDLSVITDLYTPMRMRMNGKIRWSTPAIYKVNCESDIRFYPLDYQSCEIRITTAGYTAIEIQLQLEKNPVSLMYYTENGEWELLSVESEKPRNKMEDGELFTKVIFRVNMRRRPLFHVLNTMFPVALMAFLIPMAFKLHVDSGEKIGYSLTVLLAYAVYLSVDDSRKHTKYICLNLLHINLPGIYFGRGNHCCTLRHYRYQRIPHLGRQRDPICLTVVCMLSTNMLLQKTKETLAKTNENRANVHARQQAHRENTGCR
nr:acetylcholine receptor subunit delta [Crassostrea gigas]